MKKLLTLPCLMLLLSCTNSIYHVASVQSEQVKPVENDFVAENEHLKLVYNLWEEGGRMRFLLFNKTDQPLYIDWSKSFFKRNNRITGYNQLPPLPKRAASDTVRYVYKNEFVMPYRITARESRQVDIPAQTWIAVADFPLQQVPLPTRTPGEGYGLQQRQFSVAGKSTIGLFVP